jgi:hypothetical protein
MGDHSEAFVEAGEAAAARRSRRSISPPNLLGDFLHLKQIFPPFSMLAACEILRTEHPPSAIPTEAFLKFPFMSIFSNAKGTLAQISLRSPRPFVSIRSQAVQSRGSLTLQSHLEVR